MSPVSHWASLALVAALALATGACGDDDPVADPPGATSPAADAQSTPTHQGPVDPTAPAAAKKPGKKGAEAFVRYYWAVVNYAMHTGDTGRLGMLQTDNCESCTDGVRWISDVYGRGGHIRGGDNRVVRSFARKAPDGSGFWIVVTQVHADPSSVTGAGRLNTDLSDDLSRVTFTLRREPGQDWLIDSWSHDR